MLGQAGAWGCCGCMIFIARSYLTSWAEARPEKLGDCHPFFRPTSHAEACPTFFQLRYQSQQGRGKRSGGVRLHVGIYLKRSFELAALLYFEVQPNTPAVPSWPATPVHGRKDQSPSASRYIGVC